MANTFDRFDTPANTFDQFDKPEESTSAARKLGDLGISALRGAVAVPEAAVGLADIVTGGGAGKLAEQAGFRPKEAKDILAGYYSPGYKAKQQQFQQADGVLDKAAVAITNPSLIANAAVESLPATFGGGLAARGILAAAPRIGAVGAGAIGEGVLGAGSAAEQIRQETPTGDLTSKQAALAALSGVGTAAFGYAGGKAAKALGIGDVDTLIAQGGRQVAGSAKPKGLARRAGEGFASEGFLEELPQSLSEQALQNVALDKPVTEGLADAAVMGTLTGGLMGGAAGAVASPPARSSGIDPAAGPISKAADKAVLALPAPVITVDGGGGAATADQRTKAKQDIEDVPFRDVTAVPGEIVGPNPPPGGAPGQPLIGFDQTPTGTLIAGPEGIAPQTRADAINVQQAAAEREAARAAEEQRQIDLGMRPAGSRSIQEKRTPLALTDTAPSAIETVANTEARAAAPAPAASAAQKPAQAPAAAQAGQSFTTYDEAAQFISEQRKRGTSVQALPLPMVDGTFGFAMKGTPDYTIAEFARKQNDLRKAGVVDGDVLSRSGDIFKSKPGAAAAARVNPGTSVVSVQGGFVVRKGIANVSTAPAVGGVDSRTAVAAGTQPGGSAGTAAPLSAGNTNGVQPTAKAPAPGSGTNLPVRTADSGGAVAAPAVVPDTKPALGSINQGVVAAKNVAVDAPDVAGRKIDRQWTAFAKDSGTLGIPRAEMPQIKADARGALVNYLAARGVKHAQAEVLATSLKPTQAEFSPAKVAAAKEFTGGDRSILVSSDGHILDGHHQWMARREAGATVKVIRLDAPIKQLLADVREFPSAQASPPAAAPVTAAIAPAKPGRKVNAVAKAAQQREAQRADYFATGNVVKSYGGFDRVVGYTPPAKPGGAWSVKVQAVVKQGDQYVPDPKDNRIRDHSTDPEPANLKAGPLQRAVPVSQPQGEVNGPEADQAQQTETQRETPAAAAGAPAGSSPTTGPRALSAATPDHTESAPGDVGTKATGPHVEAGQSADAPTGPVYSRASSPLANATTVADLQSALRQMLGITGALPNGIGKVVATTSGEIKSTWEPLIGKSVRLGSEEAGGSAIAFYDPGSRTVFLLADRIRKGDELAVLAHELMHKHGQDALGKAGWDRLHAVLSTWKDAPVGSPERAVYSYAAAKVQAAGAELSNQELFPYAVEAAIKAGIKPNVLARPGTVERWLASVREVIAQVWQKVTGKPGEFKAQDLVNLAFGIAQRENPAFPSSATAWPAGDAPAFSKSAINSVDANIRRGAAAMNKAILEKADANRAMFRTGIGWVDFVWGDSKRGIQHIIEQRQAKDGLTRAEAIRLLQGPIVETIAKGVESKRVEFGKSINLRVDLNGNRAVLVKKPGSNAWLLTGFELGSPGSPTEGFDSKGPTQTTPTRTRRGLGAGDGPILAAGAGTVKGGDTPMFSRTIEALQLNNPAELRARAAQALNDRFNAPGKLNWWHKTVGTMYNLAQRSPEFKRVFDAGQAFINDVSAYATAAADLAPRILPKLETWRDIGKSPLSAADTKAISAPIFEGTLLWGRDEAGKLVRFAELEAHHAAMTDDEKAQMLLRTGIVSEAELKRWKATPLPIYEGAIRNRFERTFGQPGVVFSDAELRGTFNLSDQQIGLYREFRTATDKSLNDLAVSDMLRYGGKDVDDIRNSVIGMDADAAGLALRDHLMEKARELPDRADVLLDAANKMIDKADRVRELVDRGYAPLSRFGQHTLDIVDKDGERVYFGLFESAMDAAAMQRRMVVNFPEAKITRGTVSEEAYKLFSGVSPETLELFGDMLGLEAQGSDAGSKAFQEYLRLAKSNRSAMKRLIERKGIAGFSEDAGRVLAGFVYSNARQTAGNMHMGELTEATSAIPQQQGELKDAAFKMADYIKNPVEEAQAIRGLLFAQYLGGSIASAMVNMTQPIAVTTPYLSQFGGAAKAASRMTAAIRDALKPSTGDAVLDAALKRAADEGIVAPQEVHQLLGQAQGRGSLRSGDGTRRGNAVALASNTLSKVSLAWGKLFSVAEQFNRRTTFIAAYRTAVEEGIADPAKFAEKAIAETQFVYNKGNKPAWARGAIGGTLFTFKQYSISYIELLTRMANAGTPGSPERAAGRRAALLAVGVMFLMGGAGGLPFADDLDDVIDGVMQRLGYSFSSKQAKKEFLTNLFGQGGARFIEGGISGLPGVPIDVSGRLGLGNVIPGTGLFTKKTDYTRDVTELVGPAGDFIKRGFQSANQLLQGDVGQAALTVSPTATRNLHQAFDMAMTGMYRDGKGKKVLDVDAYDVASKAIGFQPTDVARVQEATGLKQNLIAQNKLRETEIADMWAMGMFEKDPAKVKTARDALARWNESNPTAPIVIKLPQIAKRVKEMSEDKATRIEKTAPKEIRASVRRDLAEDLR